MTFNAWGNVNHFDKSKMKNAYKDKLREWFIPTPNKTYDKATITFTPTYKDHRKRDSDGMLPSIKYFIDAITDAGWLKDDDKTTVIINCRTVDSKLSEHKLLVTVELEG